MSLTGRSLTPPPLPPPPLSSVEGFAPRPLPQQQQQQRRQQQDALSLWPSYLSCGGMARNGRPLPSTSLPRPRPLSEEEDGDHAKGHKRRRADSGEAEPSPINVPTSGERAGEDKDGDTESSGDDVEGVAPPTLLRPFAPNRGEEGLNTAGHFITPISTAFLLDFTDDDDDNNATAVDAMGDTNSHISNFEGSIALGRPLQLPPSLYPSASATLARLLPMLGDDDDDDANEEDVGLEDVSPITASQEEEGTGEGYFASHGGHRSACSHTLDGNEEAMPDIGLFFSKEAYLLFEETCATAALP